MTEEQIEQAARAFVRWYGRKILKARMPLAEWFRWWGQGFQYSQADRDRILVAVLKP